MTFTHIYIYLYGFGAIIVIAETYQHSHAFKENRKNSQENLHYLPIGYYLELFTTNSDWHVQLIKLSQNTKACSFMGENTFFSIHLFNIHVNFAVLSVTNTF